MQRHQGPSRDPQWEPDETTRRIERMLERALPVTAPPRLSERIYRATADSFVTAGLHGNANGLHSNGQDNGHYARSAPSVDGLADDLHRGLGVTPPDDLADRVYQATAERLEAAQQALAVGEGDEHAAGEQREARPAVIGRIGFAGRIVRVAVAAAVLMLVAVGVWQTRQFVEPSQAPEGPGPVAIEPGTSEPGTPTSSPSGDDLVQQIERSLQTPVDPIDTRIMALSAEVDQLAHAVEGDPLGDALIESTNRVLERSYMLEGQLGAF